MAKFFTIKRIIQASEHLQNFESKWIIVPLVFAVNGVNDADETNINAVGQAGSQQFLNQYFTGELIGLSSFPNGNNSLRPRFADTYGKMVSEGQGEDYVTHQKMNLWGSGYSSRGYREMKLGGLIEQNGSKFKLTPLFFTEWAKNLPGSFHFEELLVWLYAFRGFKENISSWEALFVDFQEAHLGKGERFPRGYEIRFNVNNGVSWPKEFTNKKPSNADYQYALMPSRYVTANRKHVIAPTVAPLDCEIEDDDPRLIEVRELLDDNYAGVIFTGPPGTSKSWYAEQIAAKLVDLDPTRARFIQFHPSYQYEDFVEGYIPLEGGGFKMVDKHLLEMCDVAKNANGKLCVLVIEELSRSDPGRVFGEALSYIEMTKRGKLFRLASGREISIPPNLIILATMNPFDRSVDDVDTAFERRFAKIAMDPDRDKLKEFLSDNGMDPTLSARVLMFFDRLLKNKNVQSHVGHAYFRSVRNEDGLRRLWNNQLRFHFEKAFRLSDEGLYEVTRE